MKQQRQYIVREAIDMGCKIYEVVNTKTGNRTNYFVDYESAEKFAEIQNDAVKKRRRLI